MIELKLGLRAPVLLCFTLSVSYDVFCLSVCLFLGILLLVILLGFVSTTVVIDVLLLRNKKKFAAALWCFAKEASSIAICELRQ